MCIRDRAKRSLHRERQRNLFAIIALVLTAFMITATFSIGSVSYTHLDVYKRQLLGLDAVFQINPQRNFTGFFWLPLREPPFDALGDGFFGVGFAQRFAAGEPPLSGRCLLYTSRCV